MTGGSNQFIAWAMSAWAKVSEATDLEEIRHCAVLLAEQLDFEYFAYGFCSSVPFMRPKVEMYTNYPLEWVKRYQAQNYALSDPTVLHSKKYTEAVVWSKEIFHESMELWNEAQEFNLKIGVAQPSFNNAGGVGLLTLARSCGNIKVAEFEKNKPYIKMFSELAGARIQELELLSIPIPSIKLSLREKEVLRWTADGKTSEEIGLILNITMDSVNFHQKRIQSKMGASNRIQAVSYAVAQGLI